MSVNFKGLPVQPVTAVQKDEAFVPVLVTSVEDGVLDSRRKAIIVDGRLVEDGQVVVGDARYLISHRGVTRLTAEHWTPDQVCPDTFADVEEFEDVLELDPSLTVLSVRVNGTGNNFTYQGLFGSGAAIVLATHLQHAPYDSGVEGDEAQIAWAKEQLARNGFTLTVYENLRTAPALDTSAVTDVLFMFAGCARLRHVPSYDLSSVTNAAYAFYGCASLPAVFPWAIDLASITSTSAVHGMFEASGVREVTLRNVPETVRGQLTTTSLRSDGVEMTINFA